MTELEQIPTMRQPVTTTYHGVDVTEDYRWLEDASSEDTQAWTKAQHERTMSYLTDLPSYDAIRRRAEEILTAPSTSYRGVAAGGGTIFALKRQPPKQQPFLVALGDLSDASSERAIVDPNELDPSGATTIDWFVPSPDGARVAVSLSEHGTEDGTLHVFDAETGELEDAPIPRITLMGGSIAWRGDSGAFWYTRYPAPDERPAEDLRFYQEVWFHRIDAPPAEDRQDLAGVFTDDRIVENFLSSSTDGRWVLDRAQRGDGGEWELFVRPQDGGEWWQVASIEDRIVDAALGSDEIFLLSRKDASNGQILRLPLEPGATAGAASVVIPASALAIESLAVTEATLWVLDMDGGTSGIRRFALDGAPLPPIEVPPLCAIDALVRIGDASIAYPLQTYVDPPAWWVAADGGSPPWRTAIGTTTELDLSGIEVRRVFATSDDGTRVPISVLAAAGTLERGAAPTLLTAYGGYGISLKPWFHPNLLLWLERGLVVAIANIRGGGEYGDAWHQAGRLLTKQNCFDDFAACARFLVSDGITTADRLAIMGGSNGGLLMGAVLTQHPDIARAVVAQVPVLDMLRVELQPNGVYNVAEFGTVEDPEQFAALSAYSPYHHVTDGVAYPAVLLTAGEFDPRVDASHAKKMTARLQAATSSDDPVLLRIEAGGHGMGQSLEQEVALETDVLAFVSAELGVERDGD
ncbi:MAG TPA: prolyl oligopeptidase family serine peptidase [Actinomycetota bacterium]|nr:prolyl oligopeptidase family serine peptidase [Actinomycetota bacterium]